MFLIIKKEFHMDKEYKIKQEIFEQIENVRNSIDTKQMYWIFQHIIEPRKIKVTINPDSIIWKEVWLITDNLNEEVSSYKIVFDEDANAFGLICTLESGIEWYMGVYGSFSDTIESM
jgi:hypothetical protein